MSGEGGKRRSDRLAVPWKHALRLIREALREDIGGGDVTSKWIFSPGEEGDASLLFKEDAVVAGLEISRRVWEVLDGSIRFRRLAREGDSVEKGTVVARLHGKMRSLLAGERTALNFLQKLSGIATLTHAFVRSVEGTGVKILDTRKTTPGWRSLEKYAVRAGGGYNHRMGLYDMVLVKENHISRAGSAEDALAKIRRRNRLHLRVEVEVRNIREFEEVLGLPGMVDAIMLDNMSIRDMRKAARLAASTRSRAKRPLLEASGNITLGNVRDVAETGVDCISVGALTHSARSSDASFLIGDIPGGS